MGSVQLANYTTLKFAPKNDHKRYNYVVTFRNSGIGLVWMPKVLSVRPVALTQFSFNFQVKPRLSHCIDITFYENIKTLSFSFHFYFFT